MLAGVWAALEAIPIIDKWISMIIASYVAYKRAQLGIAIDNATRTLDEAKTSEDKKRAADALANAFRHL